MKKIHEQIGIPAALEQCAEECAELGKICLKLSRKLRGENPTPATNAELDEELHEEVADVMNCISVLMDADIVSPDEVYYIQEEKMDRWQTRLHQEEVRKRGESGTEET